MEMTLLVLLIFLLANILPPLLGTKSNSPYQETISIADATKQSYPPPVTDTLTNTPTNQPYPPPIDDTLPGNTPSPESTITTVLTLTPTPRKGPANTPIPLATRPTDSEGEIIFFDLGNGKETKLKKIDVDKDGKPKDKTKSISTNKLPYWDTEGMGGLGRIYPSPDGKKLFILLALEGPAFQVIDINSGKIDSVSHRREAFLGWHPDSKHILLADTYSGVYLTDLDGKNETKLAQTQSGKGMIISAAVSPDGKQVVYTYISLSSHGSEIWIMDDDGKNVKKLIDARDRARYLAWSPDGQKIAFYDAGYWVMSVDGGNAHLIADLPPRRGLPILWSPDSQMLLVDDAQTTEDQFAKFEDGNIFLIDVASGEVRTILPDGSKGHLYPAWSPDGQKIAFISIRGGKPDMWVINRDGTNLNQITNEEQSIRYPLWRTHK
jgi:dipeptidyl aminopeptidase/acylaminoacyl peptidase